MIKISNTLLNDYDIWTDNITFENIKVERHGNRIYFVLKSPSINYYGITYRIDENNFHLGIAERASTTDLENYQFLISQAVRYIQNFLELTKN